MTTLIDISGLTPVEMHSLAVADVQSARDAGNQMHRRAVRGRRLIVHVSAWDRWAFGGRGGLTVSLRVDGQYTERGLALFRDRPTAEAFAMEVRSLLESASPPVPGEVFVHPRRRRSA